MTAEEIATILEEDTEEIVDFTEGDSAEEVNVTEETINITSPSSYNQLDDKPKINDVELKGNKSFEDLGAESLTNLEIEEIINSVV